MKHIDYSQFKTADQAPALIPPDSVVCGFDDDDIKLNVRCVCGKCDLNGNLVECEECHNWLHGSCVFLPRNHKGRFLTFHCPFCKQEKIRCKCGNNFDYHYELIQCPACKFYVHRKCELKDEKITPKNFVCMFCLSKNDEPDEGLVI